MSIIETKDLIQNTSLKVAWVEGPHKLSPRGLVQYEYFSWEKGVEIELLDGLTLLTWVGTGLMSNDPWQVEYLVKKTTSGLSVVNQRTGSGLAELRLAAVDGGRPATYIYPDPKTGLVFDLLRRAK